LYRPTLQSIDRNQPLCGQSAAHLKDIGHKEQPMRTCSCKAFLACVGVASIVLGGCGSESKGRDIARQVRTITSTVEVTGATHNATTGVRPGARLVCSRAEGAGPNPNACFFFCAPNCGPIRLQQGQDAIIPGGGTITLTCEGNTPLLCTLTITE